MARSSRIRIAPRVSSSHGVPIVVSTRFRQPPSRVPSLEPGLIDSPLSATDQPFRFCQRSGETLWIVSFRSIGAVIESRRNHWAVDRHPAKFLPEIGVQRGDVAESAQNFWRRSIEAEAIEQVVRAVSATRADNRSRVLLSECGFQCATTRLCRASKKAVFRENLVAIQLRRIAKLANSSHPLFTRSSATGLESERTRMASPDRSAGGFRGWGMWRNRE